MNNYNHKIMILLNKSKLCINKYINQNKNHLQENHLKYYVIKNYY